MTILDYDAGGFIVGVNRMSKGIDFVHNDTQEIIQILKAQRQIADTRMKELTRAIKQSNEQSRWQDEVNNTNRSSSPPNNSSAPNAPTNTNQAGRVAARAERAGARRRARNSSDTTAPSPASGDSTRAPIVSRDSVNLHDQANRSRLASGNSDNPDIRADDTGNAGRVRTRDANGRFTREGGNPDTNANGGSNTDRDRDANGRFTGESKSTLRELADLFKGGGQTNLGGVDPILDSLKETKDLLSPLSRTAKLAGRVTRFSASKLKAMKRREPLPADQDRHNRENEKLLDKIWKAIRRNGGGGAGGGGLIGGILGGTKKGAKRLFKAVGGARGLGAIGALVGAGSLASNWSESTDEERAGGVGALAGGGAGAVIGGTIGSIVPVVGTAVGAVVGGYLGAKGGEWLGIAASPYISSWTDDLKKFELTKKMLSFWEKGIKPVFSIFNNLGASAGGGIGGLWSKIKGFMGFGGGDGGAGGGSNTTPAEAAIKASDYAIQKAAAVSLGKCAEYVNNAFQSQGLQAQGHGKDVAGNLFELNKGKFEYVNYDENYVPQIGDVMSMPSSKNSKHGYGHGGIYTSQGWVSDFKQGEKYGNTAAPNADYYEDIKSGRMKPTIVRMINPDGGYNAGSVAGGGGQSAKATQAMNYFMSKGWTKAQAAGIVGNLQKESGFDHTAVGDSGKAYGIAQWHPDRRANYKRAFGKDMKNASFTDQLGFVHHELTKGEEQKAGNRLRKATTAAQAGAVVSQFYERPKKVEAEKRERAAIAESISRNHTAAAPAVSPAPKVSNLKAANNVAPPASNAPKIFAAANTLAPAGMSSGYAPAGIPILPALTMPKMPAITKRLDTGGDSKPLIVQATSDNINQNVSDRALAHAITGGLGAQRQWA